MPLWLSFLAQFSILAYALLGGVFLAFSDFIMRALSVAEGGGGAAAMQAINREVFRFVFIPLFLAMAPISVVLAAGAWMTGAAHWPFVVAGAIYLLGAFAVTIARNVPMNNALAALDANGPGAQSYWVDTYVPDWTFWNSVRAASCILAAAIMLSATA